MLNYFRFAPLSSRRGTRVTLLAALWLVLATLLTASLAFAPRTFAQSQVFHNEFYNSDITVNKDGSYDIQETLKYVYDSGSFHRGTRFWDTDKLTGISNIQVSEVDASGNETAYRETNFDPDSSTSGVPGTFGVQETTGRITVRWVYPYTPRSGFTKTFVLRYHVDGPTRVYSDHDELNWYAVPPDWQGDINSSRVSATFPQGFDANSLAADKITSIPSSEVSKQGNTVTWSASGNLRTGFRVGVQVPKGVLNATEQVWQPGVDQQEAYNNKTRPFVDLIFLVLSLLIGVGGVLWVVRRWYSRGRDKPVKLFSDYITEPPSNLPPGLVGTLLDESADVRDVIATVVDLARKGDLTMQELEEKGFLTTSRDFEYRQTAGKVDYRYEQMVLDALFATSGQTVRLSELKNQFYTKLPPIYDEMYQSLVALKYFPESPKAVRNRNFGAGCFIMLLGAAILGVGITVGIAFSGTAFLVGAAVAVVGLVWLLTSGSMPRKTDMGAEEAAKWRAFANYLSQMQKYTNVQQAADKFQQYLPYAVALGIEKQLIYQFNSVPAAMPAWYMPYGYYPYPYYAGVGQQIAGQGGGPMPTFDPGAAMQGMSNTLAGAMQGMSDSFTNMVNSASSIFTSQPSSSGSGGGGGGWGGGGGGFGGSGGGGGGGGGAD
jgi:uncharacterized protein (TIGR04222 family)